MTILKNVADFKEAEVAELAKYLSVKIFKKNELIFSAGRPCGYLYFIEKGYVRFYELSDGLELTTSFGQPGKFVTSSNGFFNDNISTEYLQAISPVRLLAIKKEDLQQLEKRFTGLLKAKTILIEDMLQCKEQRIKDFIQKTAVERYKHFMQLHPDLMQVVSVNHLSSYLGMKPETLSRARAKVIF